jgi:alcohol dehydrogenase (cytochrome c)
MKLPKRLFLPALAVLVVVPLTLLGQGQTRPDPSKPPTDSWTTYHGDYSGRHYSPLKQITTLNVKALSLAWVYHSNGSTKGAQMGGDGLEPQAPPAGRGPGGLGGAAPSGGTIKSIPLMLNGIMYLTTSNNAYAIDARTGQEVWHFYFKTVGGGGGGNRGMAIYGDWLYFQGGEDNLVSLEMKTGKERWHKKVANAKAGYFNSSAPVVIHNHVLVGAGGDTSDIPAWIESRDPETGDLQWQWYVTPRKGEPGIETWPSEEAAIHGGGGPWQPVTYDPDLNLVYVTTANPNPVLNGLSREGANLYTSSIVALNPDTGKMVWYFQTSPHDTHDWDATQDVALFDGTIDGKPRKLMAQANRNGWLFVLDRTTGKGVVSKPFITTSNAYLGKDAKGQPIPNAAKEPSLGGVLVSPDTDGAANFPAPTFDPDTGLFYVNATEAYSIFYLTRTDEKSLGWSGASEYHTGTFPSVLRALDYKTGNVKWEHKYDETGFWSSTYPGMLSTGGGLIFTGDPSGNFVAFDASTGKNLWHFPLGGIQTNAPMTYRLGNREYVVVACNDALYAFYLQ